MGLRLDLSWRGFGIPVRYPVRIPVSIPVSIIGAFIRQRAWLHASQAAQSCRMKGTRCRYE